MYYNKVVNDLYVCASGSAVEHLLAKEGVAGSIPVSRSERDIRTDISFLRAGDQTGFDISGCRLSSASMTSTGRLHSSRALKEISERISLFCAPGIKPGSISQAVA